MTDFVSAVAGSVDAETVARRVAPHRIEHDPLARSGRDGTAAWIRAMRDKSPAHAVTIKHMLADGDLVFVHSHVSATPANEMSGINRYDFYRLDKGLIVQHWVVQAPAPTRSANGNSAFSKLYAYPSAAPELSPARVRTSSWWSTGMCFSQCRRRR